MGRPIVRRVSCTRAPFPSVSAFFIFYIFGNSLTSLIQFFKLPIQFHLSYLSTQNFPFSSPILHFHSCFIFLHRLFSSIVATGILLFFFLEIQIFPSYCIAVVLSETYSIIEIIEYFMCTIVVFVM